MITEKTFEKQKIIIISIIAIIIIGSLFISIEKFNIGLSYSQSETIEIPIKKEFKILEAKKVIKEIIKGPVILNKADVYGETLLVTARSIDDSQIESIVEKINEEFEIEKTVEDITKTYNPNIRIRDIVKPYVVPFLTATLIITIYTGIRFRKLDIVNTTATMFGGIIISEVLLICIYGIARLPVNKTSVSIGILVFITVSFALTVLNEKKLADKK